jgi:hypothetical protein
MQLKRSRKSKPSNSWFRPARPTMFRSTLAVLASTSAILISIPARAADLPSPVQPVAPVAYAPSFSWTGFYVGGELGWIRTNPEYTAGAVLLGTPFVVSAATGKDGMSYACGWLYRASVWLGVRPRPAAPGLGIAGGCGFCDCYLGDRWDSGVPVVPLLRCTESDHLAALVRIRRTRHCDGRAAADRSCRGRTRPSAAE